MKHVIQVYDPKKQIQVKAGIFDTDTLTFWKKAAPKHYMVKEHGYGFQEELIPVLEHLGCSKITIETKTTKHTFDFACLQSRKPKDYGHGLQRFLAMPK